MQKPLLKLEDVGRIFASGDGQVAVLQHINIAIHSGEMVAVVGPSGCGKSTLMNILGCLDKPTCGIYHVDQKDVALLDKDDLASLRREYFGFIFQRYHLLNRLTARENVEVPAIYSGMPNKQRQLRAGQLLSQLGLQDKINYHPSQLSGGQQQRVSIARALMNGGKVILADEPTGALDSKHGEEVMQILKTLHQAGHTIILVTHDAKLASRADRIITMQDGQIISDQNNKQGRSSSTSDSQLKDTVHTHIQYGYFLSEAFKTAWQAIFMHRMRSFLTMLGIIIGIASVVSIVAIGNGTQRMILSQLEGWGSKMLLIFPDSPKTSSGRTAMTMMFNQSSVNTVAKQFVSNHVSPEIYVGNVLLRRHNMSIDAAAQGVGEHYFDIRDTHVAQGSAFTDTEMLSQAQVVILNQRAKNELFNRYENPIGQIIWIKNLPCKVIGVAAPSKSMMGDIEPKVFLPHSTATTRLFRYPIYNQIAVGIKDDISYEAAKAVLSQALTLKMGKGKFTIFSAEDITNNIKNITGTLTLLVSSIGLISLLVGGIGIMNIMLVSVTERTQEIGIRMAVGARQNNILQQFLIEAILICLIGGALGVLLSFGIGCLFNLLMTQLSMHFSVASIVIACLCSSLVGIIFGFLPARNAARLDPAITLNSN